MKFNLTQVALLTAFVSISSLASAETTRGGYIGGGASSMSLDTGQIETSGTGISISGGYQINPWFGVEAVYVFSANMSRGSTEIAVGSLNVTPKFTLDLNDTISIYGKLGLSSAAIIFDDYDDEVFSGVGTTFGLGMAFNIDKYWSVRLAHDIVNAKIDSEDVWRDYDLDLSYTSFDVHFKF